MGYLRKQAEEVDCRDRFGREAAGAQCGAGWWRAHEPWLGNQSVDTPLTR